MLYISGTERNPEKQPIQCVKFATPPKLPISFFVQCLRQGSGWAQTFFAEWPKTGVGSGPSHRYLCLCNGTSANAKTKRNRRPIMYQVLAPLFFGQKPLRIHCHHNLSARKCSSLKMQPRNSWYQLMQQHERYFPLKRRNTTTNNKPHGFDAQEQNPSLRTLCSMWRTRNASQSINWIIHTMQIHNGSFCRQHFTFWWKRHNLIFCTRQTLRCGDKYFFASDISLENFLIALFVDITTRFELCIFEFAPAATGTNVLSVVQCWSIAVLHKT